jgi:hypothetical protein
MENPDADRAFLVPAAVDDDPAPGIDDQIVPQARQPEIAYELRAGIDPPGWKAKRLRRR